MVIPSHVNIEDNNLEDFWVKGEIAHLVPTIPTLQQPKTENSPIN